VWLVDRERHAGFREASRVKVPHWRGRRRQCELLSDLPQSATRLRLAGEFPKLVLAEARGVSCAGGAGTANRQRARASNTWLGALQPCCAAKTSMQALRRLGIRTVQSIEWCSGRDMQASASSLACIFIASSFASLDGPKANHSGAAPPLLPTTRVGSLSSTPNT
jgi:hypothetical protein